MYGRYIKRSLKSPSLLVLDKHDVQDIGTSSVSTSLGADYTYFQSRGTQNMFLNSDNPPISNPKTSDFTLDEEVVRRLVERIIRLEVEQETLSRRTREIVFNSGSLDANFAEESSRLLLWNRLLRLEEDQQVVQRCLQEKLVKDLAESDGCGSTADRVNTKKVLQEVLKKSSVLGVKYLTIHTGISRYFWSVVILFNLLLCGVSMFHGYKHWLAGPTVDHDTFLPIGLIPFPAVTMCVGHSLGNAYLLDTLMRQCEEGVCGSQQLGGLEAAALLCPSLLQTNPLQLQPWSNYFNSSSLLFIQQLFPSCSGEIASYHWPDRGTTSCSSAFQTLYVDGRICYSYNLLPANSLFQEHVSVQPVVVDETQLQGTVWSMNSPHRPTSMTRTAPLHKDSVGVDQRLRINLKRTVLQHPLCSDPSPFTYQVAVHQPWELPTTVSHHFLLLPLSHSLHVAVTPHLVTSVTTPSTPCLAQHESPLLMFSHYSRGNCQLECRATCSLSLCGCVPLHLPRVQNTTKWCGLSRRYCSDTLVPDLVSGKITWEAITKFYRKEIIDELHKKIVDNLYSSPGQEGLTEQVLKSLEPSCACDCPPACATLHYHLETQNTMLRQESDDMSVANKSEINVYYKEGQDLFLATQKISIFKFTDFLAHCGGLLALFTGLSAIAVTEFFFLLVFHLKIDKKTKHSTASTTEKSRTPKHTPIQNTSEQADAYFITNPTIDVVF